MAKTIETREALRALVARYAFEYIEESLDICPEQWEESTINELVVDFGIWLSLIETHQFIRVKTREALPEKPEEALTRLQAALVDEIRILVDRIDCGQDPTTWLSQLGSICQEA